MLRTVALCLVAAVVMAVPLKATAEELSDRSYPVPGHGALVLQMPDAWRHQLSQPPNGLPPTINLLPPRGDAFSILITPFWNGPRPMADFGSPEMLRSFAEESARRVVKQAVEPTLDIIPIGGGATGFYYSATDRSLIDKTPAPGEYLYITQGQVMAGDLLCNFTILTNDAGSQVVDLALGVLRKATHRPDG